MMILISGGNGSGKSLYAEQLASGLPMPRYYLATMVSQNEENRQRIEKHRRQREGLGFHTLEIPWRVSAADLPEDALVLLEDVSNLLANCIFSAGGTAQQALEEVLVLGRRCRYLLAVTISGLPEADYHGETAAYIRDLNWLNQQLLEAADGAVELRAGQPVVRKGEPHDCH